MLKVRDLEGTLRQMALEAADEAPPPTSNAVEVLLQTMVVMLETVYHPCSPRYADLFYVFMVSTHLEDTGEWKEVRNITHNVAITQYFCRGTVLLNCIKDFQRAVTEGSIDESPDRAYSLLFPITRASKHHELRPFTTLLQTMKLATAYADTTNFPVSTWVAGTKHLSQLVNGKLGDLNEIRIKVNDLLTAAESDLDTCFQGFETAVTLDDSISDDLRCKTAKYSFVTDDSNRLQSLGKDYIRYLAAKFYRGNVNTSFVPAIQSNWTMAQLRLWWRMCDTLMIKVLVLIFLTSGMPPRMTEFASLTIRNFAVSKRNLFLIQGGMLLLSTYNKTDCVTGIDKPIARFLHPRVGALLFKIVCFIRPAQAALSSIYLNQDSNAVRQQILNYLCVVDGMRMGAPAMRAKFQSVMLHSLCCQWSNADWRHGVIQWARIFLSPNVEQRYAAKVDLQKVRSSQVGNTPRVELLHYGIESCSFEELDSVALDAYREYSLDFQVTLLHLVNELDTSTSVGLSPALHPSSTSAPSPTACNNEPSGTVNTDIVQRMEALIDQHQRSSHDKILAAFKTEVLAPLHLLIRKDKYQQAANIIVDASTNTTQNIDAMKLLNVIKSNSLIPYNTFRSVGQRQAVYSCWKNSNDVLVILPTGSGKTAAFAIPAVLEGSSNTTLVILPTVALGDDMQYQLSNTYGLSCCQWNKMSVDERQSPSQSCQIVLMTVECVATVSAKSYISQLGVTGRLKRIVIDEAHLMLYWYDKTFPMYCF